MNLSSSGYVYLNKTFQKNQEKATSRPEPRNVQEALMTANEDMMFMLISNDPRFSDLEKDDCPTVMLMQMLSRINKGLYDEVLICQALASIIQTLRALPIPSSEIMSILATGFLENKNTFAPKEPATNTPPI